jgi:hypothetical protein
LRFPLEQDQKDPGLKQAPKGEAVAGLDGPHADASKKDGSSQAAATVGSVERSDYPVRWARAFAGFERRYDGEMAASCPLGDGLDGDFYVHLNAGGYACGYLERIRQSIPSGASLPREELIREVADRAEPIHRAIWLRCSNDEKLTLIFLALDKLVSSANLELRQLMKRGLIVLEPNLRLMDEAFRQYVLRQCETEDYLTWQREGRHSNWETWRIPLILLLITLGVFLFVTQREVFNSTLSFVSVLTGGLIALLRFVGMFRGEKTPMPGKD